jgi:hypothetical protein
MRLVGDFIDLITETYREDIGMKPVGNTLQASFLAFWYYKDRSDQGTWAKRMKSSCLVPSNFKCAMKFKYKWNQRQMNESKL